MNFDALKIKMQLEFKRSLGPGERSVSILVIVGLVLYVLSVTFSYIAGSWKISSTTGFEDWKGFFEKPNWYLFPFFLAALGLATNRNLRSLQRAWIGLARNATVFIKKNSNSRPCSVDEMENLFEYKREAYGSWVLGIAIFLGLLLSLIEATSTFLYFFPGLCASTFPFESIADCVRCLEDAENWKIFPCGEAQCFVEKDFSIFGSGWPTFGVFLTTQTMQGALISIAFMLLFQIAISIFEFGKISLLPFVNSEGVGIMLNNQDRMGEFGLSSWNKSLNFTFLIIAIAMLIPIVSFSSQPIGSRDAGQNLISIFVPLIFLVPICSSLVIRATIFNRLKGEFHSLSKDDQVGFLHQEIWPFNKDVVSKLLIFIILLEYHYLWNELKVLEIVKSVF